MRELRGAAGIYALVDPATDEVRYVGQSWDLAKRADTHRVRKPGLRFRVLALVEREILDLCEVRAIQCYKGRGLADLNRVARAIRCPIEACVRGGKAGGAVQGPRAAATGQLDRVRTRESCAAGGRASQQKHRGYRGELTPARLSQLARVRTRESCAKGGRRGGRTNAESGHLQRIGKIGGRRQAESGFTKRLVIVSRWGYEAEPGLWLSRKNGKVLLDERGRAGE